MNINAYAMVFLYHVHSVFYMSDAALAEYVKFFNPQTLSHIHIPLRCQKAFRGHIESRIISDRLLGYQYTSGMNGADVRKVEYLLGNIDN